MNDNTQIKITTQKIPKGISGSLVWMTANPETNCIEYQSIPKSILLGLFILGLIVGTLL